MIGTLRKYQQTLWWVVAIVVISSFLVFFNPGQSGSREPARRSYGTVYGRPLRLDEIQEAGRQAQIAAIVRFGGPDSPEALKARFNLNQETCNRLLFREKIQDLGIQVDDASVARWIRENLKDPKTGTVNYTAFLENVLGPKGFTGAEFESYVRSDLALRQLVDVVGVAADVLTPREAESEFRRENEQARASLVTFSATNFLSSIKLDDASLRQFFTNQLANYRIPERATIAYVRWDSSNHLAKAEAKIALESSLPARLEQFYNEKGPENFRDPVGTAMTKEAALAMLRQQVVLGEASRFTMTNALEFANELYAMEPMKAENLSQLAIRKGLKVIQSPPFTESAAPEGLEDLQTLGREVAKLTAEQPFSTPISGLNGTIVAVLTSRLPPEVPTFESVESRLRDDKRRFDTREAARNAGMAFANSVTNGLAHGKSFMEMAAAQKYAVTDLPPFSLTSESVPGLSAGLNISQIKDTVFNLKPGTASRFVSTFDGGWVAFLKSIDPVDDALVTAGLNSFQAEVRQRRKQEILNSWLQHEFQASGLSALLKDRSAN